MEVIFLKFCDQISLSLLEENPHFNSLSILAG